MYFLLMLMAILPMDGSNLLVKVDFGQLEQVFTGLFQAAFIIGVAVMVLGIFVIFFPGLRRFIGNLVGL